MKEIPILGVIVGKSQVKMEQEKIKAVKEWKTPTKVKDVESFLRFANFYQHFIQVQYQKKLGKLHPLEISQEPW